MVNYKEFNKTDDHSYNVRNAIKYCKEKKENSLVFDYGVYDFYGDMSFEEVLYVSNHDIQGVSKVVFLLKDMENFTIDGNGSKFIFHSSIIPFVIKNSCNIILKNVVIDVDETMALQGKVYNVGDSFFDIKIENNDKYYVRSGELHFFDENGNDDVWHNIGIRSISDEKTFPKQTKESYKISKPNLYFESIDEKKLRVYNSCLQVENEMRVVTAGADRYACNIFVDRSKNIGIYNTTLLRSYGMGVIAQLTENIEVDSLTVKAREDVLFSLNADATHFVHCKGMVKVTNCSFSEQRDDALNIHGVFTKVITKTDEYIIVKYMHKQAKGLNIYQKNSEFSIVSPKTMIAKGKYKIDDVEVLNKDYTKIYVSGDTNGIDVGDLVEDLTWSCDLIFENNHVTNNRGRGMLIAAKGTVRIANNYFRSTGPSIIFESNGTKWFESGGTNRVIIENNVFEDCCYTDVWGNKIIDVIARDEFNGQDFYHNYIEITGNEFIDCSKQILYADNVKTVVFKDNKMVNTNLEKIAVFVNCSDVITDTH